MKKLHKTIVIAIVIAIALGILALLMPTAVSASTADDETIASINAHINIRHYGPCFQRGTI
jgi:ABC-type lipoprotein release transport system permease subunit